MKKNLFVFLLAMCVVITLNIALPGHAQNDTFYISPTGDDDNSGTAIDQPWATFDRAWEDLYPGDTLVLMDGVYYQKLHPNKRNGEPGNPITIRAQNDGKAIIDGEYERTPVQLGEAWPGPIGQYFVIEGIVARNSSGSVYSIRDDHNILRRVSGYNAHTDKNEHVFMIWADHTLLEDCIASGSGRKMILIYQGEHNTVRRCVANWQEWKGRDFCGVSWPNGGNIHVYNASHNIIENSIAMGPIPKWSVLVQANSSNVKAVNNQVLGTIAIQAGMDADGAVKDWGDSRPGPTSCTSLTDFEWPGHRAGFVLYGQGELRDNLFQDIFSWRNAGLGFSFHSSAGFHPNNGNNRVDHATYYGNGVDNPEGPWPGKYGGENTDVLQEGLDQLTAVSNSYIENIFVDWPNYPDGERNLNSMNGEGARLMTRYVDGELTTEPLWPWPMDDRIQAELGFAVTDQIQSLLNPDGFSVSVSPPVNYIDAGETAEFTLTIIPLGDNADNVEIELENPDPTIFDIDISDPTTVSLPAQLNITLQNKQNPPPSAPDWYNIPVTVSNGEQTHNVDLRLQINAPANTHTLHFPFVTLP
jgi:hypothetical protein